MVLSKLLLIITTIFGALGAIYLTLFGVSFGNIQWDNYPFIKKFISNPRHLFTAAVFFIIVSAVAQVIKITITPSGPILEEYQGPRIENMYQAISPGFEAELSSASLRLAKIARIYFDAGQEDFNAKDYKEAADNFKKSVEKVPTVSGHINLGNSLFHVSSLNKAEKAYLDGLSLLGRQKKTEKD